MRLNTNDDVIMHSERDEAEMNNADIDDFASAEGPRVNYYASNSREKIPSKHLEITNSRIDLRDNNNSFHVNQMQKALDLNETPQYPMSNNS